MKNEPQKFSTFYKTVIYFKLRTDGTEYTPQECAEGLNVRRIGSFDTHRGRFKQTIKDAEVSLDKCEKFINTTCLHRFKTAFIVVNNYKGFEIAILKYVDSVKRFGMGVNFFKANTDKEDITIYSIPAADELIKSYRAGTLDKAQMTLIKPINDRIPVALPYYAKMSDKLAHLRA